MSKDVYRSIADRIPGAKPPEGVYMFSDEVLKNSCKNSIAQDKEDLIIWAKHQRFELKQQILEKINSIENAEMASQVQEEILTWMSSGEFDLSFEVVIRGVVQDALRNILDSFIKLEELSPS